MNSKFKFLAFIIILVVISVFFSGYFKGVFLNSSSFGISIFYDLTTYFKDSINRHFRQLDEINALREQNVQLERSSALVSTFAYELNALLNDKNASEYSPDIVLARALSYSNIGDYNKIWMDFKDFNSSKIYGLISGGKTAGIIINKDNKPLALLQTDPDCVFSVYIGENKIAGIATGNYKNIEIKYIYQWTEPKIGDEVYTSGLDGIFFGGVPVGKITEIREQDLYKSAIVETENKTEVPSYLYVITKIR